MRFRDRSDAGTRSADRRATEELHDTTTVPMRHLVDALHITEERLRELAARAQQELERRVSYYRGGRELPDLRAGVATCTAR